MSKHTKGPWHVFKDSSIYSKHADYTLAEIVAGMTDEECDANARLIAAAPELLDLLNKVLPLVAFAYDKGLADAEIIGRDIESAIAKATGEQK
jgi:hypothetical protein